MPFSTIFLQDLHSTILPICFPAIVEGLHDRDGDVRSVSAKALMPISTLLTEGTKYNKQVVTVKLYDASWLGAVCSSCAYRLPCFRQKKLSLTNRRHHSYADEHGADTSYAVTMAPLIIFLL